MLTLHRSQSHKIKDGDVKNKILFVTTPSSNGRTAAFGAVCSSFESKFHSKSGIEPQGYIQHF